MLNEVHGYHKDTDALFEPIYNAISNTDIDARIPSEGDSAVVTVTIRKMVDNTFVELLVRIEMTRGANKNDSSGRVVSSKTVIDSWCSQFPIIFNLIGNSLDDFIERCYYIFSHEIIHVIESYMRGSKNNWDTRRHGLVKRGVKSHYYTLIENMKTFPDNQMFRFLYLTDKAEVHAFLGELWGFVKKYDGDLSTSQDIVTAVKSSPTYKRLVNAKKIYSMYVNGISKEGEPMAEEDISKYRLQGILAWNYIMAPLNKGSRKRSDDGNKAVFTDNQLARKMKARLHDFNNLFWKQAYKIGYDVAQERRNMQLPFS